MKKKVKTMMKGTAAIALMAVCLSCQSAKESVKESVEDVAAHTEADFWIDETEKGIISATNDFSFKLIQSLIANNKGKDFVVSPLGVVYTLEIISNGADGKTKQLLQQQLNTCNFEQKDINALRRKMMICHAKTVEDEFFRTKTAFMKSSNLLLYRSGLMMNQDFIETIGHDYFADCLPFMQKDDAQQVVDTWNKDNNHGAIKEFPLKIDDNDGACLINTLLFNGSWFQEFNKTRLDTFYVTKDKINMVEMMSQTDKEGCFRYMQNNHYAILRMPYLGAFYMDVILPHENITIDSLIKQMDMEKYERSVKVLKKYDVVEVALPKFRIQSEIDLKHLLSDIGLSEIFSEKADISVMCDTSLYINNMKQKIEMDVDEKGTHIESITSTSFATLGLTEHPTKAEFYANRPFIYFIRDSFGSICFAGLYNGWPKGAWIHYPDADIVYPLSAHKIDI